MTYHVELTARAERDLRRIYGVIHAADSKLARQWFVRLEEAILSLDEHPARGAVAPESNKLRQLMVASKTYRYRVIYRIEEKRKRVTVLHIRHGAQERAGDL